MLAVDALEAGGGRLAELAPETVAALDKVLPPTWSHGNPVDIIGDAPPERYAAALDALLADPGAEALLVLNCPTAVADSTAAAQAVVDKLAGRTGRPVLTCWLGDVSAAPARRVLAAAGLPTHETPDEAVRAFGHLVSHARNQAQLMQTPPAGPEAPDAASARAVVAKAVAEGRTALTEPEAKAVLAAFGVPVVPSLVAADATEARAAAERLPPPYAIKILSPDISHKTDVDGVALNLASVEAVGLEVEAMLARVRAKAPNARLDGVIVQPMISRPNGRELIAGLAADPTFGPVVLFGQGGIAVEVLADRVVGLPPLNRGLAREMIDRTRVARLLKAYRDRPAADEDAVAEVLERLSLLAIELPEVAELDINPLIADADGALALDARVGLTLTPRPRLAIRPYPDGLDRSLQINGGDAVHVRPIRPQDAPELKELVARTSAEDVRLRIRGGLRRLPDVWAARLTQIDYDREMALAAFDPNGAILGVARLVADPEGDTAEFALLVRTDQQHKGLGRALLSQLLDYGRERGLKQVWGEIMAENARMIGLAQALGFTRAPASDFSLVKVVRTF